MGAGERPLCSFDVGGRCRHALATRLCFDCRRFDITGTGLHCEKCFQQRHPWTRMAHNFVLLVQRPPTPEKAPVVNALAERTMREARKLLDKTTANTALLGEPFAAVRPVLSSAASTCDALMARLAGSLLQLRSNDWQKRQLAVRRIITLWRGKNGRRWWRTATRLLWGLMRDPESGDDFYVNLATLKTSWDLPLIFGRAVPAADFRRVFPCMLSQQAAVSAIQRTARRFFARLKVADLLVDHWRLVRMRPSDMKNIAPRKSKLPEGHPLQHYYFFNIKNSRKTRDRPFILFTREPKKYGEHDADRRLVKGAVSLQSYVRKMIGKRRFLSLVVDLRERVMDPLYGRPFFVDKITGTTSWNIPLSKSDLKLKATDIPTAAEYAQIIQKREMEAAARVLQRVMRFVQGRKKAARALIEKTTWTRVYDAEYKRYFYLDSATGESSWTKPAIFRRLGAEPPLASDRLVNR